MADDYLWLIGVFIALVGTTVMNFGLNLEKYAQIKLLARPPEERISMYKYPLWLFGVFTSLMGNIIAGILGLAFAPQSTISPIYSFTLVANLFWARVFLKESFQKTDFIGVFFIIVGASTAVVTGSRASTTDYEMKDFVDLFFSLPFVIFMSILLTAIGIQWYYFSRKITPLRIKIQEYIDQGNINPNKIGLDHDTGINNTSEPVQDPMSDNHLTTIKSLSGTSSSAASSARSRDSDMGASEEDENTDDDGDGDSNEINKNDLREFYELKIEYSKWIKIHPFLGCSLSGMYGAISMVFTKMSSQCIKLVFFDDNQSQWSIPWTYIFLLAFIGTMTLQVHYINISLRYFDALYCVPVYQCIYTLFSTLAGLIYFEEYKDFELLNWIVFPIGVTLTIFGAYVESLRDFSIDNTSSEATAQDGKISKENNNNISSNKDNDKDSKNINLSPQKMVTKIEIATSSSCETIDTTSSGQTQSDKASDGSVSPPASSDEICEIGAEVTATRQNSKSANNYHYHHHNRRQTFLGIAVDPENTLFGIFPTPNQDDFLKQLDVNKQVVPTWIDSDMYKKHFDAEYNIGNGDGLSRKQLNQLNRGTDKPKFGPNRSVNAFGNSSFNTMVPFDINPIDYNSNSGVNYKNQHMKVSFSTNDVFGIIDRKVINDEIALVKQNAHNVNGATVLAPFAQQVSLLQQSVINPMVDKFKQNFHHDSSNTRDGSYKRDNSSKKTGKNQGNTSVHL